MRPVSHRAHVHIGLFSLKQAHHAAKVTIGLKKKEGKKTIKNGSIFLDFLTFFVP